MDRPAVDVVVPFRGPAAELTALEARLGALALTGQDTLTIVDNSPGGSAGGAGPRVLPAPGLQTPGFARNRGAERGRARWIVFLDADVAPEAGLLEAYFDPAPAETTGLLAGGVRDEPPPPGAGPAVRYSHLRGPMSQEMTLQHGEWAFVQTANCAVRRRAFEQVDGFREGIRAGEDADLTYRLRAAGWGMERRERALGHHRSRATVRALLAQKACHGAAGAWLDRRYPGSFPSRRLPGLLWWGLRHATAGIAEGARERRRDVALMAVMDPLSTIAYELGRFLPNHRPLRWRP
jgi:GT2 family glycosyltransferase